ncbi:FAD-dependent oxidoreductase [soil metagenome]
MPSTTHPDAFHFDHPVHSYWEATAEPLAAMPPLHGDERCDIAIIGAGYTGLSAALRLRERGVDVRILEAAEPGWGASGRNGGFACIGSHKLSYTAMIKRYGLAETQRFYAAMKEAVGLVRDVCARHGIDGWINEGGEVALAHLPNRMKELADERDFLHDVFDERMELWTADDLKGRGLWGPQFHGGLWSATGFSIHPLKYVRGLARAAVAADAVIYGQSRVVKWDEEGGLHHLHTKHGRLTAKQVLVATNGYTPEEVSTRHRGRLLPALSSIIVTRPLSEGERQEQGFTSGMMAYDTRHLLHYFRLLPDGRFLFGGRGGTDASDAGEKPMRNNMIGELRAMFPVFGRAEITHFWRGFVCLAHDLVPYVGPLDASVCTAIAFHGNGVAMATWSGRAVADLMTGQAAILDLPAVITRRLARFPLPSLRALYLKSAYAWFNYQDAR